MYTVYILLCADDTLYTGITNNVEKRFALHQQGKASKYTRAHGAKKMVYMEEVETRGEALKREAAIKKLSRAEKLQLSKKRV